MASDEQVGGMRVGPLREALVIALLVFGGFVLQTCGSDSSTGACCKTCTTGKACGDTCIAANDVCNLPSGCACNAR